MANDANISIGINADRRGATVIKRDLKDIKGSANKTTTATKRLTQAFAALASGATIRAFTRFSDSIVTLETNIRNATKTSIEADRVFQNLFTASQRTGDSVKGLASTFNLLALSLPDAVRESQDLVKVTELLSRGFAASGSSAAAAQGALTQLSQGLAGNFEASAQELRSLIEGAPLLAKIISQELGGQAATDLLKLAEAGKLTSESFLQAVVNAEEAIKAFDIPPTISRSITRISNEFVRIGVESDNLKNVSAGIATALDTVAERLDTILKIAGTLAGSTIPILIRQFALALPSAIAATTTAFGALTAAIAANPIGAFAVAISAGITALALFGDEIEIFGARGTDVFINLKNTAIEIFRSLTSVITAPFRVALQVIERNFAKLKVLAFQAADLSNRVLKTNFDLGFLSPEDVLASRRSNTDILRGVASGTFETVTGTFSRANSRSQAEIAELAGLTPESNPEEATVNKVIETASTKVSDLTAQVKGPLKESFDDIGSTIKEAFVEGFKEGNDGLKRISAGITNAFNDITGRALARGGGRVLTGIAGAALGGLGFTGAAQASGGVDLGSLSSIGSLFNSGPVTLGGLVPGGIGQSLGFAQSLPAGVAGPTQLGSVFGGTTLSGALAGGAVGGLGAQLLGLGSGNALVDTGTGVAGTAIGAAVGGGPVGAAIGSFLGTAVGGLFGGGKPSDKAQGGSISFGNLSRTTSGQTGEKFSAENAKFRDQVLDQAEGLAELLQSAGATVEGALRVVIGSRDGLRLNGRNFGFNQKAFLRGVNQSVISGATGLSQNAQTALSNTDIGNTQAIADAIGIASLIDSFNEAGEAAQPLKDALDVLDAQFDDLKNKASDLGLPVDQLTQSYQKQKEAIIDDVLQPFQEFLDQQALGGGSSFNPIQRLSLARSKFDENLNAVQTGDFSNLNSLTRQASQLLSIGRDVFASGAQFVALETFVRQSIGGVTESLGAPAGSLDEGVARDLSLQTAQQTSLQEQTLLEIRELRAENTKLRKSMERVGNSLVVQS